MSDKPKMVENKPINEAVRVFTWLDDEETNKANAWEPTPQCFWWKAEAKFDGCVHLWRRYNDPTVASGDDYLHICDIDELIAQLTDLRDALQGWNWGVEDGATGVIK